MKNLAVILILVTIGLFSWQYYTQKSGSKSVEPTSISVDEGTNNETPEKSDTIEVLLNVLEALNYYNFSTKRITNFDDTTALMTDLMNAKKSMQQGDIFVQKYTNNSNEYISVTAQGMVTGSKTVQDSMENLIQYLRKVDEDDPSTYSDLEYQIAKFVSDNKEGFTMIATAAPQVTALLWEPAQSENPTGPIPYKVSKLERQRVLSRIDALFTEDLKEYQTSTDNYNSMIFAVDSIKNNIEPDTYEESSQ